MAVQMYFLRRPVFVLALPLICRSAMLCGADCNGNSFPDAEEIERGLAQDCDADGVPDDCQLGVAPPVFSFPQQLEVGRRPRGVTLADLDGDSDLDVATANYSSGDVSVLLNVGAGAIAPEIRLPLVPSSATPIQVVAADLDADGALELFPVYPHANGLPVFRADALGGLELSSYLFLPSANHVSVADLDGDSDLDLAISSDSEDLLTVALNRGDGSFPPVAEMLRYTTASDPISSTPVDFDGDLDVDLLVSHFFHTPTLLFENVGTGVLLTGVVQPDVGWPLEVIDADGDLDLDLVSGASLARNAGGGRFEDPVSLGPPQTLLTATDLTADGLPDLVTQATSSSGPLAVVVLRESRGDGAFSTLGTYYPGNGPLAATAGDIDGDGDQDLAVTLAGECCIAPPGLVALLLNDSHGQVIGPVAVPLVGDRVGALVAADLDGDGDSDLVASDSQGSDVNVTWNDGLGAFSAPRVVFSTEWPPNALSAADFNGDGRLDLAALVGVSDGLKAVGHLQMVVGTEHGWEPGPLEPLFDWPGYLQSADFDGDGRTDLAIAELGAKRVTVHWNENGAFSTRTSQSTNSMPGPMVVADVDGDGKVDMIVNLEEEGISRWLNIGNRRFSFRFQQPGLAGPYRYLAAADVDLDGDLDVAATDPLQVGVQFFTNDGRGIFSLGRLVSQVGHKPSRIVASDLDGDGDADFALSDEEAGGVVLLRTETVTPTAMDCNGNARPDACDIAQGTSADCDANGQPDDCQADCDGNGKFDGCDLSQGTASDCNANGLLDSCDIADGAPDCDGNGCPDDCDLASGAEDRDLNGIPDSCEPRPLFHRGDANADGAADTSDAIFIFGFLYLGTTALGCREAADANGDGAVDLSDGIFIFGYKLLGSREPPAPGPPGQPCGVDPDMPDSPGDLGCDSYAPCP